MMLRLFSKLELSKAQHREVDRRLNADVHQADWSHLIMPHSWACFPPSRLFALFAADHLIGLAAIDGALDAIDPAWWIDRDYRDKRFGTALVEALVPRLVADGVRGVKPGIVILGPDDAKSRVLVDKLRRLIGQLAPA